MTAPTPGAARTRRLRERRRRGVIAVVPVEIVETDVVLLVRAGYLPEARTGTVTREALVNAVERLLDDWVQEQHERRYREVQKSRVTYLSEDD